MKGRSTLHSWSLKGEEHPQLSVWGQSDLGVSVGSSSSFDTFAG
jgi:hypothetical protein